MSTENHIRALMQNWCDGLSEKNAAKMLRNYADEAVLTDIMPEIYVGKPAILDIWEKGFPMLPDDVTVEYKDERIMADQHSAVFMALAKMNSRTDPENMVCKNWLRVSVMFQKKGDAFQVVHEHVSMPMDETGRAVSA